MNAPPRLNGVKMFAVYSSNIVAVGYEDGKLIVIFSSGAAYEYDLVPPQTFKDIFTKESIGNYIHRMVKNKYPFRKITAEGQNDAENFYLALRRTLEF